MKLITAIIRPERLDELIDVVIGNGGRGLTATEVRGFGRQFAVGTPWADASRPIALLPKVRPDRRARPRRSVTRMYYLLERDTLGRLLGAIRWRGRVITAG
jgi:hypothetical protein